MTKEQQIEQGLIAKLQDLKYTYRSDISDKASLEQNFRKKFEALNRVNLSDAEFNRLREEIITADVFFQLLLDHIARTFQNASYKPRIIL